MQQINNALRIIETLIKQTNGRFFTVTFVKKDGTVRTMNARLGVKRFLSGATPVNRSITDIKEPSQYLNVWDAKVRGYRSVNKSTILSAVIDGVEIKVRDAVK